MHKLEKELVIEIHANVDDIVEVLTPEQRKFVARSINKINGNVRNLLDGIPAPDESSIA